MYKKKKFSLVITTVILMLLSFPFQSSVFAEEYLAQLANPVEAEVEQNLVCQTETISSTDTTDTHSKEDIISKYNQLIKTNGIYGSDTNYDIKPVYSNGIYRAGQVSNQNLQERLNTINMIRYLAGLESVELDATLSSYAQTGTVGLAAVGVLAHSILTVRVRL